MKTTLSFLITLLIIVGVLYSCASEEFLGSSLISSNGALTVSGTVLDENESPIAGATVNSGTSIGTTDANGVFTLSGVTSKERVVVQIKKTGYFDALRGFIPVGRQTQKLNVMMESKGTPINFNASSGATLSNQGGGVEIGPNGVMDANGNPYSGDVKSYLRFHNTSEPNFSSVMQGGDFAAENTSGETGVLSSFGFYSVEMEDSSGNALNVKTGTKANFSQPIAPSQVATAPAKIDLWSFDKEKGIWINEGTATKVGDKYIGQVGHFSSWNCDKFSLFYKLKGKISCSDNSQNLSKKVTVTDDILGGDLTCYSGSDGYFSIRVPVGNPVTVKIDGVGVIPVGAHNNVSDYDLGNFEICQPSGGVGSGGTGQFVVNGVTYSGLCNGANGVTCSSGTGTAVVISHASGRFFTIYNMPTSSNGTYNFTNGWDTVNTCSLYALSSIGNGNLYATTSGTITKTGTNSFTFSCIAYDLVNDISVTINGSGTY